MSITVRRTQVSDAAAISELMADPEVFGGLLQLPHPSEELWRQRLTENVSPGKPDLHLVAILDGRWWEPPGIFGGHGPQASRHGARHLRLGPGPGPRRGQGTDGGAARLRGQLSSGPSWFPGFNRLSYRVASWILWSAFRGLMNRLRSEIAGLPPYPRGGPFSPSHAAELPVACGVSPSVLRRPADWPSSSELTGYWFLDEAPGWSPPPAIEAFLSARRRFAQAFRISPSPSTSTSRSGASASARSAVGRRRSAIGTSRWPGLRPRSRR